jgi:hypothetical protein
MATEIRKAFFKVRLFFHSLSMVVSLTTLCLSIAQSIDTFKGMGFSMASTDTSESTVAAKAAFLAKVRTIGKLLTFGHSLWRISSVFHRILSAIFLAYY